MEDSVSFNVLDHVVEASHVRQYAAATSTHQGEVLHLAVKQYTPRYATQDGDATILACHASAFPKELYEPIWSRMFNEAARKAPGQRIRSIFIADVVNQGASGVLNEQKLGNEPSYYDHARDYLHLVNHFREEMKQPILGFGHSMGGNVIINLALLHPRLIHAVVAIEPVINTLASEMNFMGTFPLTVKKDKWPSKDAAISSIAKSPFYAKWTPQVLDLYKEHGLRSLPKVLPPGDQSDPKNAITLTTTKHQEVVSFARAAFPKSTEQNLESFTPDPVLHPDLGDDRHPANAFYRPESTMTFQQLPFLRPSCFYIYGEKSHMAAANSKGRNDKLKATGTATGGSGGAAKGKVTEAVVKGSHFVPFEMPDEVALLAGRWFDNELARWRQEQEEEHRRMDAVPFEARSRVTEEWVQWVHRLWGRKKGDSASGRQPARTAKL
ncbi:putative alpha/beta hydrolase-1 [Septoria linicola]|nr:putative alpha/beta hydrolase-1 [Septoria linicola]